MFSINTRLVKDFHPHPPFEGPLAPSSSLHSHHFPSHSTHLRPAPSQDSRRQRYEALWKMPRRPRNSFTNPDTPRSTLIPLPQTVPLPGGHRPRQQP